MTDDVALSLRERKQHRTRQAIQDAAMELFTQRGFDGVTVTDIAARAEVGRSTFFRYYADKQEVLFADEGELRALLVAGIDHEVATRAVRSDSLADAVRAVRAGVLSLSRAVAARATGRAARDQIIAGNPQLQACNVVKERGYVATAIEALLRHGVDEPTAILAANLGAACYATAHLAATHDATQLPDTVSSVFLRLGELY